MKLFKIVHGVIRESLKNRRRSPEWKKVRRTHLASFPECAACGGKRLLQVHHIEPFHLDPELELDSRNLITLCMGQLCHIELGHGDDFKAFNPSIINHAQLVRLSPHKRPIVVKLAKACRKYVE
jgi:hypothetical protein